MAELKKIVFIITDLDFGGAEQILFELCRGLKEKFQIQVLVLKRKGYFAQRIEELGIPVKSYQLGNKISTGYLLRFFLVLFRAMIDLRKIKPDLLQGFLFQGNLLAKLAGRFSGVKLILCSLHTFDQGKIQFLLERLTSFLSKKYLVVSNALRDFALEKLKIPKEKIIVIRNGIQIPRSVSGLENLRERLGVKPASRLIGTVGRLHREKGMDLLIRAFHCLAQEFPETILVIIGEGPEKGNLQSLAEDLGIKDRVIFLGFQPEPEKYLALFELFVLPSRIEGLGLALMQAMALGKACIAFRVGGVLELVEEEKQGLLIPAEDELRLAQAITKLFREPELRKRLGENARAKAEQEFRLEKMIDAYKGLYLELLGEKI